MTRPAFISTPDASVYLRDDYLVLDFEVIANDGRYGSAVDPRNQLYLACWTHKGRHYSQFGGEFEQAALVDAISKASFLVGHNVKYELGWLRRMGVDLSQVLVYDTQIAEYVLLGNLASGDAKRGLPSRSISLDACCKRRGWRRKDPVIDIWLKHGLTVDQFPRTWLYRRCVTDVGATRELFLQQRRSLSDSGRLNVLLTRCLLTPVLADIEAQGMHLDKERVNKTYDEYSRRYSELLRSMDAATGGINWRSPIQAAEFVYDRLGFAELTSQSGKPRRTPTGQRSVSAKTLDRLKPRTAAQREYLGLRAAIGHVNAALSKNLNYFKAVVDDPASNDIFYAELNQTRTATHRLSSSGIPTVRGSVQFQNLPRAFKGLFSPRDRQQKMAEADSAQLEFRVAAFLGNDTQAKADIANPEWDAHVTSAASMAGRDYDGLYREYKAGDKGAAEARQAAKPETFKPLYGGQKGTPTQERWYKEFRRRYPELADVQSGWVHNVIASRERALATPWGLKFYYPHARMSERGYVNVTASIYNYPVQSLATAEIIPIALVYLWHRVKESEYAERIRFVNTVHDSVAVELDAELGEWFQAQCIEAFTLDVYRYLHTVYLLDFDVPLGAGVKIGDHLGEGKETAVDVYPDGRVIKRK